MTNAEKFKEVFGMNPDERFCPLNECTGCRYERKCEKLSIGEIRFWNNEYKGVIEDRNNKEIEQLEYAILLIKQNGKDYLDERDIPILETAIDTMRKYKKIQEIVEHWACCGNPSDSMIAISEVLEDGNKLFE